MREIEINTAHNVVIKYRMAGIHIRIFAWFIDIMILGVFYFLMVIFVFPLLKSGTSDITAFLIFLPIIFFYWPLTEIFMNGQTPGKRAVGIRVMKMNGKQASPSDFFLRWVFRIIDISFSLGGVAIIMISATEKGQRIGDIVADTVVVNTNPLASFNLGDILKMNDKKEQEITYPGVAEFSEEDMLLLKECYDRYKRYGNDSHKKALTDVLQIFASRLNFSLVNKNSQIIVKTLIRDYVNLTR